MCLAIPGKVKKIFDDNTAEIEIGGIIKRASLELIPQVSVGDYVLLHAGFAIEKVDPDAARDTLKVLEEYENALRESTTQQKERKISHRKNIPA